MSTKSLPSWKQLVLEKRKRVVSTIPKEWLLSNLPPIKTTTNVIGFPDKSGLLSEKEKEITNTEIEPLLAKLANRTWSSVEVTTAFSKRAIVAHQLVNCLTEVFIERALARAAELDEHLKSTGKVVGPLHGLPVSIKDQVSVKGYESTIGFVSWIGKYATKNAVLADVLEASGAVLYVKTNVPQSLLWTETYNHIFGRTLNPHNRTATPGGSSGGEGALIALRGSLLGVGSDIAGSIRIPAAFNGLYGFRPSANRIPYAGCVNSLEGEDSIPSVLGPLSTSLAGVKIFMKSVLGQKPWLLDPITIRKPWNEDEYRLTDHGEGKSPLCFAIFWHDEVVLPTPPVTRALEETKKALIKAGHKVIDWKPHKQAEIYANLRSIWGVASAEDYHTLAKPSGEPIVMHTGLNEEDDPGLHEATDKTLSPPSNRVFFEGGSAYQAWQHQKARRDLREEYLALWNATVAETGTGRPIDAIISPASPYTAPPHGQNKTANYTLLWNNLDYPALVMPVGLTVDPVLDAKKPPHKFFSPMDQEVYELYTPERFKDTPITIQVVGRTLEDEAVIGMGEIVDTALKVSLGSSRL